MKNVFRKLPILLIFIVLLLSACVPAQIPVTGKVEPSIVEPVAGSEYSRVILTEKAVQRLDIQTTPVSMEEMDGSQFMVIPYSAVMYGLQGETWAYTNPETRVYIRHAIVVERIEGDLALLTEGPEVGTPVVTVGASMLYGAEVGVSK